jgi:hypothetical protein
MTCGRKIRYGHIESAEQARRTMLEKGRNLEVYRCDACEGFHLGHPQQKLEITVTLPVAIVRLLRYFTRRFHKRGT